MFVFNKNKSSDLPISAALETPWLPKKSLNTPWIVITQHIRVSFLYVYVQH